MAADFSIRLGLVGVSQVITGIQSAIGIISMLIQKVVEASKYVAEYSSVVEGHTVSVDAANRATRNLIDSVALHRAAAKFEQARVTVTSEQLRALALAATQFAQRTGQDVTQTFDQLTDAVMTGGEEVRRYGVSLEGIEGESNKVNHALQELTRRFSETTIEIENTADAGVSLKNSFLEMMGEMGRAAERNGGTVVQVMDNLAGVFNSVAGAIGTANDAAHAMSQNDVDEELFRIEQRAQALGFDLQTMTMRMDFTSRAAREFEVVARSIGDILTGQVGEGNLWDQVNDEIWNMANRYDELSNSISTATRAQNEWNDVMAGFGLTAEGDELPQSTMTVQAGGAVPSTSVKAKTGERSGGAGRSNRTQSFGEFLDDVALQSSWSRIGAMEEENQLLAEIQAQATERMQQLAEELALEKELSEVKLDEDLIVARLEAEELLATSLERQNDALRQQSKLQAERAANEQGAITLAKSFSQALGIVGSITDEVAGKQSTASKVMRAAQGGFLVAFNSVMAITEAAKAISSYPDFVGMATHAAGAIAHTAAAVEAGIQLGSDVGGPKTTAATGGAPSGAGIARAPTPQNQRPEWAFLDDQTGEAGGRGTTMVVNFNGPVTSARAAEELQRMQSDGARDSL